MDVNQLNAHLGGKAFYVMTGFRQELIGNNYVQFKTTKNNLNASKMIIRLVNDEYVIEFGKIRKMEYKVVKTIEGIPAENLKEVFERETGLYTTM